MLTSSQNNIINVDIEANMLSNILNKLGKALTFNNLFPNRHPNSWFNSIPIRINLERLP